MEDLRDSVVGEHCQSMNVVELSVTLSLEGSPEVGNKYLGSFVEEHLVALVDGAVSEAREACSK